MQYKRVLTIAGSDPGGGAGIQADIKTISACGCYALSAITAVTVQNTVGVSGIHPVPAEIITAQISTVLKDIGADAIKIGMLHSSEVILGIKQTLSGFPVPNLVLDPVMVSTSGHRLIREEAVETLKNELPGMARVITPNIPEAEILLERKIIRQSELPASAAELGQKYRVSVLLKGGHLDSDDLTDLFWNAETGQVLELKSKRICTVNTHGTGCTLSSALAAFLAKGLELNEAVGQAKAFIDQAITAGSRYRIGQGHGPVHHFFGFWE